MIISIFISVIITINIIVWRLFERQIRHWAGCRRRWTQIRLRVVLVGQHLPYNNHL